MKIKRVILDPDPRLYQRAEPLRIFDIEAKNNVKKMFKVMKKHDGVGLAAPQVGWPVRLFIMFTGHIFWNPVAGYEGEPELKKEGCLSLPKVFGMIRRHPVVVISGKRMEGLAAQIVQHEIDHLMGVPCWTKFEEE